MALVFIGKLNVPNYTALSTDVADSKITGASIIGATVLLTDTASWKIIKDDLTLADYALPISFNGSVDIGAVHLDQNMTDSIELSPIAGTKSVTVAGTAEALSGTSIYALSLTVFPKAGNVGSVYFGDSGVDRSTSQQIILTNTSAGIGIDAPVVYKLNLADFYVDADNPGDGVKFIYLTEA